VATSEAPGPNAAGRLVLAFMAFALLVLFVGSFLYRMQRPSLEVRQERPGGMSQPMAQAMNGPMKEVLALMQKLKENPDDPELQLAMAEQFMAMGSFERAKTFLDKVVKVRPENPDVQNALGVTLYNLKDIDGAKAAFEGMLARDPDDYRARFNLGLLYKYALKEPEKAVAALKAVADSPKTDPETRQTALKELVAKPAPEAQPASGMQPTPEVKPNP
jgi:Flp pilus assembly protein TadD